VSGEYLLALAITLLVEVPIVALLFPGQRVRMAIVCAIATTDTHLLMHFALIRLASSYDNWVLLGEVTALVLEACAYVWFSRPRRVGPALIASAAANSASYVVGWLVF
jgi:hypothetical protein